MNTLILIYILAGVIVILLIWILITERRLRRFFAGKKAKDLEEVMTNIVTHLTDLQNETTSIQSHLVGIDKRLDASIRNVQTLRFNPFEDAGSNQSFAISLLNDNGDGVILSSLYARDRMSIFAKPIKKGVPDFDLSDEEKEVLAKSQK